MCTTLNFWHRFVLGLCLGFALACGSSAANTPIRVSVALNNAPPYRIVNNGQYSGFYVELFNRVAMRMGWQLDYTDAPFSRVLRMLETGTADIMLGPLRTAEREKYMTFVVDAFPPERKVFLYKNPANRIDKYGDLYNKRIGVMRGSSYFPEFDGDPGLKKEVQQNYDNLLRMLDAGHVDVVLVPELLGIYTAHRNRVEVQVSPFSVAGTPSYIAMSRKSPLLPQADQVRQTVERMRQEGAFDDLLERYRSLTESLQPDPEAPASP